MENRLNGFMHSLSPPACSNLNSDADAGDATVVCSADAECTGGGDEHFTSSDCSYAETGII